MKKSKDAKEDNIDFGFISFDEEQVQEIVEKIGFHFSKSGYLRTKNNESKNCDCCGHSIKKGNLGSILPGSDIVYCDNAICYTEYMDKYLKL